jgi:hypothetical protein
MIVMLELWEVALHIDLLLMSIALQSAQDIKIEVLERLRLVSSALELEFPEVLKTLSNLLNKPKVPVVKLFYFITAILGLAHISKKLSPIGLLQETTSSQSRCACISTYFLVAPLSYNHKPVNLAFPSTCFSINSLPNTWLFTGSNIDPPSCSREYGEATHPESLYRGPHIPTYRVVCLNYAQDVYHHQFLPIPRAATPAEPQNRRLSITILDR